MASNGQKIKWSFRASLELVEIEEWLSDQVSEAYAEEYIEGILEKVEELADMPERYGFCRSKKLQEAKIRCINYQKKHIVFYLVKEDIEILAIIHARRHPSMFDEIIDDE
ncbi:MAG: type II toxin-antitoxin system RelE/ParE family toxin [Bacteroidota bacterium]